MNPILIGILLAVAGLVSSLYWKLDAIEAKSFYQQELARITAESAESKKQLEEDIHALETKRVEDKETADQRIKQLEKRIKRPALASCNTDSSGRIDSVISDSVISVLTETVDDPRIPKADNPAGFVDPQETVTTDTLAAYSFYTIEQYNNCAADYNSLIDMVK
jgi:FtsZ-interacting cell division protein ZipA